MASHQHKDLYVGKFQASNNLKTAAYALLGIGILTLIIGFMKNQERLWTSYLAAFFFFSTLALGGMFFVAIQHIVKAGWSVTVRRYAEAMTSFVPVMLVGALALILGIKYLYPWANAEVVAANPVIAAKTAYLNVGFLVVRLLVFCGGVWFFKSLIVGGSLKQDADGNENYTTKNVGYSIAYILFFAIMFSIFSVDLLMSLLPTWYSTIFGVYCFAGMFQAALAFMAIVLVYLKRSGMVRGYVTEEHQHDIAKFMKGFTVFWAYIAFSQFMLIWYANIPEETEYYIMRSQNGWLGVSLALLIFRFIVPFIALLPKGLKRNDGHLVGVAILILVMQYVDIYWMIYPNFFEGHVTFGLWEIGMMAFFAGLFLMGLLAFFTKNSLVPLKDPRIHEAISHHVTY
jgi:hypothetical protein